MLALYQKSTYFLNVITSELIEKMSIEERLQAMEQLWDAMLLNSETLSSPAWHEAILQDRKKKAQEGRSSFLTL